MLESLKNCTGKLLNLLEPKSSIFRVGLWLADTLTHLEGLSATIGPKHELYSEVLKAIIKLEEVLVHTNSCQDVYVSRVKAEELIALTRETNRLLKRTYNLIGLGARTDKLDTRELLRLVQDKLLVPVIDYLKSNGRWNIEE